MDTSAIIIDNFVLEPDKLRETALMLQYRESDFYKGFRATAPLFIPEIDEKLQKILGSKLEYKGASFHTHYTMAGVPEVVHADPSDTLGEFGGVLYLNPKAPFESGTALYRHKETLIRHGDPCNFEKSPAPWRYLDETRYDVIDFVGNIYNRLILFDGNLLHSMAKPFGYDRYTARLTMLFFVNRIKEEVQNVK